MRRVGDTYVEASWDEAVREISARMNALIDADGPDAVGIYYGNPSGFSSSNIIFMNAWLDAVGTRHRYCVGSVDQNAMHVVASAMYGSMLMAPVSDIDSCDYFLLVGTNPAVSAWNWLETVPDGWRRALARQNHGAKIVVVDPLRTETAEKADVHLAVRPGQDWALLLGMVKVILDEGLEHRQDCTELATGVGELRQLVADAALDDLASRCDLPRAQIELVARDFAAAHGAMVMTRTGVSLHLAGTVAEWLGHVLNVITGRMDRPGGRRYEPGYVDALRLADLAKAKPHKSRLAGRSMVAGARAQRIANGDNHPGTRPDQGDADQLRKPRGLGTRRSQTRRSSGTTGSVGGHRLRAAREPPSRALAAACRALAGTRRPARVH
jgi:formate dehydrogenase